MRTTGMGLGAQKPGTLRLGSNAFLDEEAKGMRRLEVEDMEQNGYIKINPEMPGGTGLEFYGRE